MKKLNRPAQPRGRLKLGKLCGSFLLVYGLSSAAFLYVCAHFPHRPEEETQLLTEKKKFPWKQDEPEEDSAPRRLEEEREA